GKVLDPFQMQGVQVSEESLNERLGVLGERDAGLVSAQDGLVVHVREVHHVDYLVPEVAQAAPQQVSEAEGAEVADVDFVVDGGAAGVDADLAGDKGMEGLELAPEGVEEHELGRHFMDSLDKDAWMGGQRVTCTAPASQVVPAGV